MCCGVFGSPGVAVSLIVSGWVLCATSAPANARAIELRQIAECLPTLPYSYCVVDEPALSPDGRCVALSFWELWPPDYAKWPSVGKARVDGSCSGRIAVAVSARNWYQSPTWSPDGRYVAYVAAGYDAPAIGIWSMFVGDDTDPPASLVHVAAGEYRDPAWSLDADSIACVAAEGIFIVPSSGGTPILTIPGGSAPSWGPGRQIVFARDGDLWIHRSDGSERRLTRTSEDEREPAWSPRGGWIAYSSNRSGDPDIWVIAIGGGTPVQVTSGPAWDSHPSWSWHGDRLAFLSTVNQDQTSVWVATNLPDWAVAVQHPTWSDVKRLFR